MNVLILFAILFVFFVQLGQVLTKENMEKGEERYYIIMLVLAALCIMAGFIWSGIKEF